MGKQVIDLKPQKGMTVAQSNEHLRNFSEEAYKQKKTGNFDPTREHLNFEITKGGIVSPVNKSLSIPERIHNIMRSRGVKDPNERLIRAGQQPKYRTVASFILGGSTEDMRRLAFGEQNVDFEKENNPDNSWVKRQKGIEEWAVDVYNFMAKKYGEENIAAFVVHLDEKNPHVHCTILPITKDNKISWHQVITGSGSKYEVAEKFRQLHNEFAEINKKYGLERGDDTRTSGAKHKEYNEYLREENAKKKKENATLDQTIQDKEEKVKSLDDQYKDLRKKIRSFQTMLLNQKIVRDGLRAEIESLTKQRDSLSGDTSELDAKIAKLRKQLDDTENVILHRNRQLDDAKKEFEEIKAKIAARNNELKEVSLKTMSVEKALEGKVTDQFESSRREMGNIGWNAAALDAERRFSQLSQAREMWTPEQRNFFDKEIASKFDGSLLSLMAERSDEIVDTAAQLFMGIVPKSASGGGGGGAVRSGLKWNGKRDDEDDMSYKVRCFTTATQMVGSSGRKKKKGVSY